MLFDGPPAALPVATLRPAASQPRAEIAGLHLWHWITSALGWARPRTVPLVVAFLGMLAVLGATRYLLSFAEAPVRMSADPPRSALVEAAAEAPAATPAEPASCTGE